MEFTDSDERRRNDMALACFGNLEEQRGSPLADWVEPVVGSGGHIHTLEEVDDPDVDMDDESSEWDDDSDSDDVPSDTD